MAATEQIQPQTQRTVVAACSAHDCRHNRDGQCHAGRIEVRPGPQGAVCATYAPEAKARP